MFNLFKKVEKTANGQDAPGKETKEKKSLYRRFQDAKTREISDDDLVKYTGKTKDQIREWGKTREGVAGNQAAGKLDMGGTTGLGGMATAEGYGGWGTNSNAPLKFPPKSVQDSKKKEVDEDDN